MSFLQNSHACLIPSNLRKMDVPFYDKHNKILYFISVYSVRNLHVGLENDSKVFYVKPDYSTINALQFKHRIF